MDHNNDSANGQKRKREAMTPSSSNGNMAATSPTTSSASAQASKKMRLTVEPPQQAGAAAEAASAQDATEMSELEERVVREQRKQLLLKNKELKREIVNLQQKLQETRLQSYQSDANLAVITRYWNTLTDDLVLLLKKDFAQQQQQSQQSAESSQNGSLVAPAATSSNTNPTLLQQLLADYDSFIQEEERERIEEALVEKCKKTKDVLTMILQGLIAERSKNEELMKKLKDDAAVSKRDTTVHSLREANTQLKTKSEELEKLVVELRKEKGTLEQELKPLKNKMLQFEKEQNQLTNDFEDLKVALEKAERKYDKLKLQFDQQQRTKQEMMDLVTPTSAKSALPQSSEGDSSQKFATTNTAADEELQLQLQLKTQEIEALSSSLATARSKFSELEVLHKSESFVKNSATYAMLHQEHTNVLATLAAERAKCENFRIKLDQVSRERKQQYDEKERELDKFKQEYLNKLQAKEQEIVDMKVEVVASESKVKNANALVEEANSYRTKYDELLKKLNSLQEEFTNRSKDFATLDVIRKKLKDSRKGEELAKKLIKELTIKVDHIKNMPQDARELFEVRASEAKYRDRAKTLEEELTKLKQEAQDVKLLESLKADVETKNEEVEVLNTELEKAWNSTDEMKAKFEASCESLREKEDEVCAKIREQFKFQQTVAGLQKENQVITEQFKRVQDALQARESEILLLNQRVESHRSVCDVQQLEIHSLKRLEEKLIAVIDQYNAQVLSLEKQIAASNTSTKEVQIQITNANNKIVSLETKLRLIQNTHDALQVKYNRAMSDNPLNADDELNYYKGLTKCSVCQINRKNTVITRCFHTFCKECVQANLQVRNRKCPTCKIQFGQGDVREIYL